MAVSVLALAPMLAVAALCGTTAAVAVAKDKHEAAAAAPAGHADTLMLVLLGDFGLNRTGTAVDARGVLEGPTPVP